MGACLQKTCWGHGQDGCRKVAPLLHLVRSVPRLLPPREPVVPLLLQDHPDRAACQGHAHLMRQLMLQHRGRAHALGPQSEELAHDKGTDLWRHLPAGTPTTGVTVHAAPQVRVEGLVHTAALALRRVLAGQCPQVLRDGRPFELVLVPQDHQLPLVPKVHGRGVNNLRDEHHGTSLQWARPWRGCCVRLGTATVRAVIAARMHAHAAQCGAPRTNVAASATRSESMRMPMFPPCPLQSLCRVSYGPASKDNFRLSM